jgi:tRNA threonylcarbamoyladenosine modification (KEOPS) complex  Pcc1 subunit
VRNLKAKAIVKLKFLSERNLHIVFEALQPETRKNATMRSEANLMENGEFLVLEIGAKDSVALRAAVNAYLRWIDSTIKVLNMLEREY